MKLWIETGAQARAQALFGLPPLERLRRSITKLVSFEDVILSGPVDESPAWVGARSDVDTSALGTRLRRALGQGEALVAVDAANAIDPRLIRYLLDSGEDVVASRGEGGTRAVVLRLSPAQAGSIPPQAANLCEVADALLAAGHITLLDDHAFPAYVDKLRRFLPYWIYAVDDVPTRRRLERRMFWDNYKGSTDLLTRWVFPPLVWPLVRFCTRWRIHPNTVTVLSIVLAFAAVPLFARGDFLAGFICAYAMSVLDSVDGKVARVTLTDSKIGNLLDHGLDQVHPPFWYFAWAWGLGAHTPEAPLYQLAVWLIIFYVADRIVLGIARHRIGFALHAAGRLDERARSFIARRNITMTIMALALLFGAGAAGLYAVTAWQGLTLAWHSARTAWHGFLSPRRPRPEAR